MVNHTRINQDLAGLGIDSDFLMAVSAVLFLIVLIYFGYTRYMKGRSNRRKIQPA